MTSHYDTYKEFIKDNIVDLQEDNLSLYFGKKGKRDGKRHYVFFEGLKNYKVSGYLLSFFKRNFENLITSTLSNVFNEDEPDNYVVFNLEDIDVWNQFEPVIYKDIDNFKIVDEDEKKRFNKKFPGVKSLKKLKYQINHYLLIYESEDYILGQISRIYSKQILHAPKFQFIFKDEKFTDVQSQPNIEIDEHDSVLFFIDKDNKIGFTKNKKEYEDIFDMDIQYRLDALNTVENSTFKDYCDVDMVKSIVNKDLTIQRMLNNPVTKFAFETFEVGKFSIIYNNIKESNPSFEFGFNFSNNKFIIDANNERKSLRELVKFVGYYYTFSLDEDAIVEGNPKKITKLNVNEENNE